MKITPKNKSIYRLREDGTAINYYIFPEYEIHYCDLAPGITQPWHHHNTISESIYVISGEVAVHYLDGQNQTQIKLAQAGDVIEVKNTPHTLVNKTNQITKLVAFRFVPDGQDKRELIKNDKVLDTHLD